MSCEMGCTTPIYEETFEMKCERQVGHFYENGPHCHLAGIGDF